MKRWLPFLLTAWWIVFGIQKLSAQWVTIPDPNFLIFLQNSDVAGCLNGNQLDSSCPAVVNKITMGCSNSNIADLTGIEAFVNLEGLICANNQLVTLPTLPPSLTFLDCQYNQIVSLPLPPSLVTLYSTSNLLTSLPTLPSTLIFLDCRSNLLSTLPTLPASLTGLWCGNNELTSLPTLPPGLTQLRCGNNQLTSLPSLPPPLTDLQCHSNQLNALPTLPPSLEVLYCSENQLITLPSLPATLNELLCGNNQITSLASLPSSLSILHCGANPLYILPTLPATLTKLYCYGNYLTVLPNIQSSLTHLNCSSNQLTTLPILPASLTELECSFNQLTSLPSLPSTMAVLSINNNSGISCLPPIEKITGYPPYSSIAGTAITCLPNVIQHTGSIPSIDALPLCGIFGNGCEVAWNIEGKVFRDDNLNCTLNSGETSLPNIKLQLHQGGMLQQQVYSNGAGNYSFDSNLGTFDVSVDTTGIPFVVTCPVSNNYTSTLITTDSLDYNRNFALFCKPGYDLAVQSIVHNYGLFFPAQQAHVRIDAGDLALYYGVNCNSQGLGGTVTATYSGPVNISGVSGNGLVAGNTVTWSVSDFSQLNFFNDFGITFLVDTIPATDSMCVSVSINPSSGTDNNPSSNTLTQCFNVVNSFDPNFKEVYPESVAQPSGWHTYTVHFQNTGTAPAIHILVKDTLDSNLDWNSFQLLSYSHNNLTQVLQNGIVHFSFPNISLPDSTSDEPNSHGWIQYRIKTDSTITPGTTIHNTAAIYFDFNDPIITNDAIVTYCLPVETQQSFNICISDSIQVGSNVYHQAGTYTNLFTNFTGCDSVVVTTISTYGIDTALIVGNASIAANGNASAYQWFDCNTNQPIPGATNQIFTPLQNGSYAVELTYGNNCTTMSSCIDVTIIGITSIHQGVLNVYPNPSSGNVQFDLAGLQGTLTVYNTLGQAIQIINVDKENISLKNLPQGLLTYKFVTIDGALYNGKITVQR